MNTPIVFEEVLKAIKTEKKKKKSPGIDQIPNKVLKNPGIAKLLHKLFVFCFENAVVPKCELLFQPITKQYMPHN